MHLFYIYLTSCLETAVLAEFFFMVSTKKDTLRILLILLRDWPYDKFRRFIQNMVIFVKKYIGKYEPQRLKTLMFKTSYWSLSKELKRIGKMAHQILKECNV